MKEYTLEDYVEEQKGTEGFLYIDRKNIFS